MLKVFLVEDEAIIRESIKKNIHWEEYGFIFCGEAGDGELAYSLICEKRPDVVITDIKMPFMDGLELGQLLHQDMPWIKIILLTGYGEFEYAKKAIHIGAVEYLLKPVSSSQLTSVIKRVGSMVTEEREQRFFMEQYRQEMQEREKQDQLVLFEDMVSGAKTVPELLGRGRGLGLSLSASCYAIVLFTLYYHNRKEEIYSEDMIGIQNTVEDKLSGMEGILLFKRGLEGYALLLKGESEDTVQNLTATLTQSMTSIVHNRQELSYFIGVGSCVKRLSDLPRSFYDANRAFAHKYFLEKDQVVYADSIRIRRRQMNDTLSIHSLNTQKIDRGIVEHFLHSGSGEDARYFIDELFDSVGLEPLESLLLRQYVAMDIYLGCAFFLEKADISKTGLVTQCGDIQQLADQLSTTEDTKAFLTKVLRQTCALRDEGSQKKYSSLIAEAKNYILQNYGEADTSLNVVAKAVNISPTHFSAIFSRETGQTFVEYLTAIRMEKAKEMLCFGRKKTSEIAYEVGYQNPHYFSFLFKKLNGITPREFRAKGEAQ